MSKILDTIEGPEDLRGLSAAQLNELTREIRELITQCVSRTGGHLASNLGIVELTVALHTVFDFRRDRLLWDVGHQCYAHKILTGRKGRFEQLRQEGGISGFPNPSESETDVFSVGHAGTSIATALGMALGAQHRGTDEKIVAVVGDASIVNGPSFEALNNLGLTKRQLLVILNDNSMAIDVTQGAMARFLSRVRLSHTYEDVRNTASAILEHLPVIGRPMEEALENFKRTVRMSISPNRLFESLNISYFGPVDGHDIQSMRQVLEALSHLDRPALLHVYTRKGKGFEPADDNPRKYHSTGPFELNGNGVSAGRRGRSFTEAFGDALADLAAGDPRVTAITAAMPDGTGLMKFRERFKDRYYDVGIAESAALDIAAGMARQGLRPMVCIYSTFLQRSFDQIFQEVSLQNLPVTLCIDRAGVVGDDGSTHHGLWDIAYLRVLPHMTILAPANETELRKALAFALEQNGPTAIRYPRDVVTEDEEIGRASEQPIIRGQSVVVREGDGEVVLVGLGSLVKEALRAADLLAEDGIAATVVNARFAKPVDARIAEYVLAGKLVVVAEDHSRAGGFGEAVAGEVLRLGAGRKPVASRLVLLGGGDGYLPHASRARQLEWMGVTAGKIAETVKKMISPEKKDDIIELKKVNTKLHRSRQAAARRAEL